MPKTYHVGLLQVGNTAVFQFREDKDCLSCEILDYFGEREQTKTAAKVWLKETYQKVLATVNDMYPGPNTSRRFTKVRID
jgi:hypothetical protein